MILFNIAQWLKCLSFHCTTPTEHLSFPLCPLFLPSISPKNQIHTQIYISRCGFYLWAGEKERVKGKWGVFCRVLWWWWGILIVKVNFFIGWENIALFLNSFQRQNLAYPRIYILLFFMVLSRQIWTFLWYRIF